MSLRTLSSMSLKFSLLADPRMGAFFMLSSPLRTDYSFFFCMMVSIAPLMFLISPRTLGAWCDLARVSG